MAILMVDPLLRRGLKRQHTLASLAFTPVTIAALRLRSALPSGKDIILLAAGGQDAELFLAAYQYTPKQRPFRTKVRSSSSAASMDTDDGDDEKIEGTFISEHTTMIWQHSSSLIGSINNNVLLYLPPPSLDRSNDAVMDSECEEFEPVQPRLVVSNNDCTVKFFDVSLARNGIHSEQPPSPTQPTMDARYWRREFGRSREGEGWSERGGERIYRYERVGCLRLPVPVNHSEYCETPRRGLSSPSSMCTSLDFARRFDSFSVRRRFHDFSVSHPSRPRWKRTHLRAPCKLRYPGSANPSTSTPSGNAPNKTTSKLSQIFARRRAHL